VQQEGLILFQKQFSILRVLLIVVIISFILLSFLLTAHAVKQPTPTFSPQGGYYSSPVTVTISSPGAALITYTLDVSDPQHASTTHVYSSPITISSTTTIKAFAVSYVYTGLESSDTASATYTINSSGVDSRLFVVAIVGVVVIAVIGAVLYFNHTRKLQKPTVNDTEMRSKKSLSSTSKETEAQMENTSKISAIFCRYCGKENKVDAAFCRYCGRNISD
jgi:cytoskeletal protein RodZ